MLLCFSAFSNAQKPGSGIYADYTINYRAEKCAVGQFAPEINANNEDDIEFTLSSLQGKVVLVQFWASECRPCQSENVLLSRIYDNYKNKKFIYGDGFEIYSISLDIDKNKWREAIVKQRISAWIHVCERTGVNSVAAKNFNVSAIPANFLIDGRGKIVAKSFRANELQKLLTNFLE